MVCLFYVAVGNEQKQHRKKIIREGEGEKKAGGGKGYAKHETASISVRGWCKNVWKLNQNPRIIEPLVTVSNRHPGLTQTTTATFSY